MLTRRGRASSCSAGGRLASIAADDAASLAKALSTRPMLEAGGAAGPHWRQDGRGCGRLISGFERLRVCSFASVSSVLVVVRACRSPCPDRPCLAAFVTVRLLPSRQIETTWVASSARSVRAAAPSSAPTSSTARARRSSARSTMPSATATSRGGRLRCLRGRACAGRGERREARVGLASHACGVGYLFVGEVPQFRPVGSSVRVLTGQEEGKDTRTCCGSSRTALCELGRLPGRPDNTCGPFPRLHDTTASC